MSIRAQGFVPGMIAGALLLATGLAIGGAGRAPETDPASLIRAKRIEIVDDLGTVRLALGQNETGGAVSVRDAMGRTMMLLGVATGGGVMVINESDQRTACVRIAAGPDGGEVAVGRGNTFTGQIGTDATGAGTLSLRDAERREVVAAGAIAGTIGRLETFDARSGSVLNSLSATRDGQGQLRINGPDGHPRAVLTASERREGQLYTFGDGGRLLIAVATREAGPALRMFNIDGETALTLELDDDEGGRVVVYDRDGLGRGLSSQPPRNRITPTEPPVDVPWRERRPSEDGGIPRVPQRGS